MWYPTELYVYLYIPERIINLRRRSISVINSDWSNHTVIKRNMNSLSTEWLYIVEDTSHHVYHKTPPHLCGCPKPGPIFP